MNIFEYKGYYQDYLDKIGIDLSQHYDIPFFSNFEIDVEELTNFSLSEDRDFQIKHYMPRPFHPAADMMQATCLLHLGYNVYNCTEKNIGLNPKDNQGLIDILGDSFFEQINLDKKTTLVRFLEYSPGNGIPLHTDSYNGFRNLYGDQANGRRATRFFVAVSPWDWGHMLQIHDNIITHWKSGDTYEIEEGIYHLSNNFGIAPKHTLTITGFVNE